MKIIAIVPMRHNSERVPGKNFREFSGKPLYHYIIETLLECEMIEQVVIDTDSSFIIADAEKYFPKVLIRERPTHLRAGEIPMYDVLQHTISTLKDFDFFLQTHSTNPLLTKASLEQGINFYSENYPSFDSVFSVTKHQTRLWDDDGKPINHDPDILLRTQDLPPVYEENSCMYLFSREVLKRKNNRIGDRPYLLTIPKDEAFDIDEETDFIMAELMYKYKSKNI